MTGLFELKASGGEDSKFVLHHVECYVQPSVNPDTQKETLIVGTIFS